MDLVASEPTPLVGAFSRADGNDGSFVVFESDGTYLYQEAQDAASTGNFAGYERGCYTATGSIFTISLGATCRPNSLPALDLNNRSGFSPSNGAAIPFVITGAITVTIGGVSYNRIPPN